MTRAANYTMMKILLVTACAVLAATSSTGEKDALKKTSKRGTFGVQFGNSFPISNYLPMPNLPGPWNGFPSFPNFDNTLAIPTQQLEYLPRPIAIPINLPKHLGYAPQVSPVEIEAAITAAKDASSNVLAAQQRVLAAKEAVLAQQRIASARESAAQAAQQRSEAAAQAQRVEASAAATAVVLAQQRLADAKAQVAAHQRIAAAKESHAAAIIHKSANAAAIEIQRTEAEAAKLAALQRSESAAVQHAAAAKDASLAATAAAVAAHPAPLVPPQGTAYATPYHPWG